MIWEGVEQPPEIYVSLPLTPTKLYNVHRFGLDGDVVGKTVIQAPYPPASATSSEQTPKFSRTVLHPAHRSLQRP